MDRRFGWRFHDFSYSFSAHFALLLAGRRTLNFTR